MKIAGVSEALSPLKNTPTQSIITPLIRNPNTSGYTWHSFYQ